MSTAAPEIAGQEHDHSADITAMFEEIGMAVATGLVPFVGQAINIYDTVQSLLTLHNSKSDGDRAEAKFDLVLALVGWIPGAGGVSKSRYELSIGTQTGTRRFSLMYCASCARSSAFKRARRFYSTNCSTLPD